MGGPSTTQTTDIHSVRDLMYIYIVSKNIVLCLCLVIIIILPEFKKIANAPLMGTNRSRFNVWSPPGNAQNDAPGGLQ